MNVLWELKAWRSLRIHKTICSGIYLIWLNAVHGKFSGKNKGDGFTDSFILWEELELAKCVKDTVIKNPGTTSFVICVWLLDTDCSIDVWSWTVDTVGATCGRQSFTSKKERLLTIETSYIDYIKCYPSVSTELVRACDTYERMLNYRSGRNRNIGHTRKWCTDREMIICRNNMLVLRQEVLHA